MANNRMGVESTVVPIGWEWTPLWRALADGGSAGELVQAQAGTTGFVVLREWVEILERHFPPRLPDPGDVAE
ncbi:hypothetical protein [Streptomyces atratus]|uniref:hypothetical protein n=1 Tax=Streptomyces atratus TaxID=1893 RepID=UPI00365DD1BE